MEDRQRTVFNALAERFGVGYTYAQFQRDFSGWTFDYIYKLDQCIGATISRNGFIHVAILEQYRKSWAKKNEISYLIRSAMKDGKAYTTLFKDDEFRKDFAKRLGFRLIEDGAIQTYEVTYENLWK